MAINHCARLYGFGTYFVGTNCSNDIDVLILHNSNDELSCQFAVECKNSLRRYINSVHVTILSLSEEREFDFRKISRARYIGIVKAHSIDENISDIVSSILNWQHI